MTEPGVSDSDMPTFPWPTRPEAQALDALLDGGCRPEEVPAELRSVADFLVTLQSPPDRREIAGWGEALTVYRAVAGRPAMTGRPRTRHLATTGRGPSRRPRRLAPTLGARLAAAAGAVAVATLGAGVAAAYTGILPGTLQRFAHETLAAPAAHASVAAPTSQGTGNPVGPSVTGPAAYGLCHAYQQAEAHGNADQRSVAFRNLARAAGGADKVTAFCAPVQKPGAPTTAPGRRVGQSGSPSDTSHGRKPTTSPGKPTAPPGKPTAPPGKPTASPSNGNGHGNG
jgi:hypothetical protein